MAEGLGHAVYASVASATKARKQQERPQVRQSKLYVVQNRAAEEVALITDDLVTAIEKALEVGGSARLTPDEWPEFYKQKKPKDQWVESDLNDITEAWSEYPRVYVDIVDKKCVVLKRRTASLE